MDGGENPLESSAEVDVFLDEFFERTIGLFLIEHEDGVADLEETATVAVRMTTFSKLWVMGSTKIIEDFTIWPARLSYRHLIWSTRTGPPIFLGAVIMDVVVRNTKLVPNLNRFLIPTDLIVAGKKRNMEIFFG